MIGFDRRWAELEPIGRSSSGGYRRFAWTREDADLREWFAAEAVALGLDLTEDRAGNQWAWWGDPDRAAAAGKPGIVTGSHLDSVPDGGAFDGPLGVVSALAAIEALQASGFTPARPIGVVNFVDEEGARFGVACAGSRILTGALTGQRAAGLRDGDGVTLAEALIGAGRDPSTLGRDDETIRRVGTFIELHIEQGRSLAGPGPIGPVGVASAIWPHGRWRFDFAGVANHAGTTALADRHDPMLGYAQAVLHAREVAQRHGALATFAKVQVVPNGVNAIPSRVHAWLDARGPTEAVALDVVRDLTASVESDATVTEESWTPITTFEPALRDRLAALLAGPDGPAPILATGAGHDAGILAAAAIPTAMIFVRNPTGISHSPAEQADLADCHTGTTALQTVLRDLTS